MNFLSCRLVEVSRSLTGDKFALSKHVDHYGLSTVEDHRHPPERTDTKLGSLVLTLIDGEKQESKDDGRGQKFIIRIRQQMAP